VVSSSALIGFRQDPDTTLAISALGLAKDLKTDIVTVQLKNYTYVEVESRNR
jgi:hypothetical protein